MSVQVTDTFSNLICFHCCSSQEFLCLVNSNFCKQFQKGFARIGFNNCAEITGANEKIFAEGLD